MVGGEYTNIAVSVLPADCGVLVSDRSTESPSVCAKNRIKVGMVHRLMMNVLPSGITVDEQVFFKFNLSCLSLSASGGARRRSWVVC